MTDLLERPKAPLLKDLKKVFKDPRTLQAIEDLFEAVPANLNGIITDINALEVRIVELEPNYIAIDATDSPYLAANNDDLLVDMGLGPVDIVFPASGRFSVSRLGSSNDLTLLETVSGDENPLILFDRSTASMAYITEWRWV